jgi:hypothetical protein
VIPSELSNASYQKGKAIDEITKTPSEPSLAVWQLTLAVLILSEASNVSSLTPGLPSMTVSIPSQPLCEGSVAP